MSNLKYGYLFIHSFNFGIRNKVKAAHGIRTHRVLMLYPDWLKKKDMITAIEPIVMIKRLQAIICRIRFK